MMPMTATPTALPTCCTDDSTPAAVPARRGDRSASTVEVSGAITIPMPAPSTMNAGMSASVDACASADPTGRGHSQIVQPVAASCRHRLRDRIQQAAARSEECVQLAGCAHPGAAAHLARQFRDANGRRRSVDEIEFARAAQQEALDRVAVELGENRELPVGLDALGHDDGAEPVGQVDDSAQDLLRRPTLVERDDERAVQLDDLRT